MSNPLLPLAIIAATAGFSPGMNAERTTNRNIRDYRVPPPLTGYAGITGPPKNQKKNKQKAQRKARKANRK